MSATYPARFTNRTDVGARPYTLLELLDIRARIVQSLKELRTPQRGFEAWMNNQSGKLPDAEVHARYHMLATDEYERNHPFKENDFVSALEYYEWALEYTDRRVQEEVLK